ncbi:MAG: sulfatase-like hydrolase/transferase [Deltaproteobacteria bacterium]|nr:sulfatase-like hydrolase/transferase [Deltaproteobacteria bacterium]
MGSWVLRRAAVGLVVMAMLSLGCNRIDHERVADAAQATGPNVVLVTIDTLRADHVGAYGAEFARTPVLDGLAAAGARFETAIAATPITLPSHATLLTGVWPPRHGVRHNGTFRLDESLPTLAEQFQKAGYATGAVVGAVVLRGRYGIGRGFDEYNDDVGTRKAGNVGFVERTATEVTDGALAWLASLGDKPFFLWVHYYDPHHDHRAPPTFAARFPDRPYDAEIAYVDHEVGRLRSALEAQGRDASTVWAVTSDHGESLGEHGETSHGLTLYDGALRVPFVLSGPGVPPGREVSGVVRAVDVTPTLLSLAGLPSLSDTDGADLVPLLAVGAAPSPHWAYAETLIPELDFGWAPLHAVRTATELYVRAPRPELYRIADDPGQERDLSGSPDVAPRVSELDARIEAILAAGGVAARLELPAEERARLQALGYALPEETVVATGLDPKDGIRHHALVQEGANAMMEQRYGDAEVALREFLVHAPASARAHGLLASSLLYSGRAAEALEHADRAVALDPTAAQRYTVRAEVRIVVGDRAGARADFERAAQIEPEDVWVQIGLQWIQTGASGAPANLAAAAEHARRAFALAPYDAFVRFRVGMIWMGAGAFDAALESFLDAVRVRPDFALAQARLAVEFARIGRLEEARRHRDLAGEWLRDAALGSELAFAIAAAGDPAAGLAHVEDLARQHPGNAHVGRTRDRIAALPPRPSQPQAAPAPEGT